jgi:hypothetical protein
MVIRNETCFFMTQPDWGLAFADWSGQIKENIGEKNH